MQTARITLIVVLSVLMGSFVIFVLICLADSGLDGLDPFSRAEPPPAVRWGERASPVEVAPAPRPEPPSVVTEAALAEPPLPEGAPALPTGRAQLRGVVLDPAGRAVGGARVRAYAGNTHRFGLDSTLLLGWNGIPWREAVSGPDGSFRIRGLREGACWLMAQAPGFAPSHPLGAVAGIRGAAPVHKLVLTDGVPCEGHVRTPDGRAVARALVTAVYANSSVLSRSRFDAIRTWTDASGVFRFNRVRPGPIDFLVARPDLHLTRTEPVTIGADASIDVVLGGAAVVEGRVTLPDGAPAEGAEIVVLVRGEEAATMARAHADRDGRYRIENLPADVLAGIRVTWPGCPCRFFSPSLPGPDAPKVRLKSGDEYVHDFHLERGVFLSGRVTERSTGRPVAGAVVRAYSYATGLLVRTPEVVTSSSGQYRIEGVGAGTQVVIASAPGLVQKGANQPLLRHGVGDPEVEIPADVRSVTKDLVMIWAAGVRGTVVDPNGDPVAGARIELAGTDTLPGELGGMADWRPVTFSREDGRFALEGVWPGDEVRVRAAAAGFAEAISEPFRLEPGGGKDEVELRLGEPQSISGVVVNELGEPLAGVTIGAYPADPSRFFLLAWAFRAVSDAEGRFVLTGLSRAEYRLGAEHPGYSMDGTSAIEAPAADVRIVLRRE